MQKRLIALVLAIAMVASTFPTSVLAEEVESEQEPVPAVTETVPEEPAPEPEPEPETEPVTEPVTEPAAVAATVTFICTPGELTLTVFPADADEQSAIKPQADGTYLLLPGDYVYLAAAEGYESARGRFTLPEQTPALTVEVTLVQSAPEQETEAPTEEATEAPTEEPTEAPTEAPTEEPTAPVPSAIPVSFACTPAELTLVVFPADADETAAIDPQADRTYLLLPGDYAYLAAAEGYEPLDGSFTIPAEAEAFRVAVVLNASATAVQSDEGIVDSGTCGENLTWTLAKDGTLTISGTGNMADYYNNWGDSSKAPWYPYSSQIVSASIEPGVTSIGNDAFYDCSSLTSVTIPDSVSTIGNSAFFNCTSLTGVSIPDSVTSIGSSAFSYSGLISVTIPNSVISIDVSAFLSCISLTSVSIPDSVTSIGGSAFFDCRSLTSVTIPGSVTSIDTSLFDSCTSLTSVTILEGVTSIGTYSFVGCTSLTSVSIPDSVTSIGESAFMSCSSLTSVSIPDSVTSIGERIFCACSSLTNASIPEGVTSIGYATFSGCSNLTSITIPNSVATIGEKAFADCRKLTDVYFDGTEEQWNKISIANGNEPLLNATIHYLPVTSGTCGENLTWTLSEDGTLTISGTGNMSDYSYSGNDAPWHPYSSQIVSVFIESGVTSIGSYAFNGCSSLTNVSIPDSVATIGNGAFYECSNLASVTIPEDVTSIAPFAFYGCSSLASVSIPDGVTSIGESAFSGCSGLTSITIPNSVTSIGFGTFWACSSLASVTIPNGVTSIGDNAFSECSYLTSVTILEGVTSIGASAFERCSSLASVTIPNSVTSIGNSAFSLCGSLADVYFGGATKEQWNKISVAKGNEALLNATIHYVPVASGACGENLTWALSEDGVLTISGTGNMDDYPYNGNDAPWHPYSSQIVSASIEPGVTSIGSCAFDGCSSLTSANIPDSVATIGNGAFYECSKLTDIYFSGTIKEQWDKISIANGNEALLNATIHYFSVPSGTCGENLTWTLAKDGTLTISGTGNMADYSYSGNDAPWHPYSSQIVSASIEPGVTSIGSFAFNGCSNLISVTIPDGVSAIGNGAFSGCSSLTSMTIPDSVSAIGGSAFSGCSSLTSMTIPNSVASISDGTFNGCGSLTSVIIPDSVTSIGISAFYQCSSLTSVTIPNSVTTISSTAFFRCSSLTSVTIPNSVTRIGGSAFNGCRNLTSVAIPDSVTNIDSYAFYGCSKLTDVYFDGAEEQWNKISIASGNEPLLNATIHYVLDGNSISVGDAIDIEPGQDYCFAFTAPESRTYVVYEKNSSYSSPNVEVFDKAGHIQKRISDSAVSFDAQAGERYQIKVTLQGTSIRTICLEEFSELTGLRVKNFWVATSFAGTTGNFSLQLEPTPTYAAMGTVTYSIADPEIAEITNSMWGGKALRLLKAGTTELIATVENGASASVPITVKAPTAIHPGESVPFTVAYTRPFAVQYTAETAGEYCFRTESGEGCNGSFYKNFEKLDPYYIDTFERLYLDAGDTIVAVIQTGYENCSDVLFLDRCIEPTQITLDKTSIDSAVGSTHYLSIDMQPINANRDVVWESSDPEVAEVEKSLPPYADGYVKTKKAGSAVITATVGSISASCVVTVSDPEEIQPGFSREVEIQDEVRFRFVAPKAARYRFWVEGDPYHTSISTIYEENYKPGDSPYASPGNPFNAEEGTAYIISVKSYIWNSGPDKITLHLDECVPLQSLELITGGNTFDVGGLIHVRVIPHPGNADEIKTLTAEIDGECIELQSKNVNTSATQFTTIGTAVKPGTATLTVTSDSGISASVPLTVLESEAITVGDAREVTLQPGEQLRYSFAAEQEGCYVFHDAANTWSPLQFSIYYVEYSARVGAGQGRAEYIAQPGLKLTLVVENPTDSPLTTRIALEEEAALSSILLSKEEITCAAGSTLTVRANTEPGNAPMSNLRWSVDDSSVASIIDKQAGNVTLACEKAGTAVLTATIGDVTASCIIHVVSEQGPISSGTCGENLTWTLTEDGTLTISGTGDMTNYLRPEIPWYSYRSQIVSVFIESGVTSIGDWAFDGCGDLTSIAIPDGVTSIGAGAFENCSSLTSLTIPSSVVSIGNWAFYRCSGLASITIPDNVTNIGDCAFYQCSSLTSLTIPNSVTSIGYGMFDSCSGLTSVTIPNSVTSIGKRAFYGCSSLASITIPDSVTAIGDCAFTGCSSLTSAAIPDGVTQICSDAFYGCSSLVSVTIPNSATTIGSNAFGLCSSLSNVTIPDSVTDIGGWAFDGCSSLASVTIPESVTSIGIYAFLRCSSLTDVYFGGTTEEQWNRISVADGNEALLNATIHYHTTVASGTCGENLTWTLSEDGTLTISGTGNMANYSYSSQIPWYPYRSQTVSISIESGVTSIGKWAFWGCSDLTSVSIPDSVTSIGFHAFYQCSSLTSVTIPNSVTAIGDDTFWECSSLTSVTIPNSVTSIGEYAFYQCSSLTSVTIPNSVFSIGNSAFDRCSSLTSITIPDGVTTIGNSTFLGCSSLASVTIPDSVTTIDYSAFRVCSSLTSVTIPDSVATIGSCAFQDCTNLINVTIPDSVTTIGSGAFEGCSSLTSVTIPDSVTTIGSYVFQDCSSLSNVTIPDSVTTIGPRAFYGCGSLTSVTIPDSVASIGGGAFYGCGSLTSVAIPNSVASIENGAFQYCSNLTSVFIPDSVTTIDFCAFWACRSLAVVYFGGTEEQWNKISIDSGSTPLLNATIHYNATHICTLVEVHAKAPTGTEDGNYQYWICSICGKAYKDALGKVETTVEAETIRVKPTVTTLTKVTGGDGSFTATWDSRKNVDGYAVQYATNSSFASCKTVMVYGGDVTSTTIKNLTAGTYYVRVRTFKTVDGDKSYSLASPALTVTVRPFRPDATTLTKVTGDKGCFTADWNIQENVDGYALQYATNSSFTSCVTVIVHGGSTASATVDGLNAGSYYVRVRTFTTAGSGKTYSLASTAMTVMVASTKPDATTLTKVTGGEGSFTAAWDSRKNVDGYAMQYATNSSFASCKTVMVYDGDVSSTTVKDLAAGTYYVRVRTFTTAGSSKTYSLASPALTVTVLAVKPTATTLANVTGNEGSFTATWDSQENVDGYAVQYATNSSFTSCRTSMVYGNNTTSATVNSLNAGTYYVRVRTFRIVGSSKIYSLASNSLTVTVASTKPAAPMLMKVTGGEGSFTATWNAQTNVAGYAVQYSTSNRFTSYKTLMVYDGSTTSITAKDLNAGTYYVRVRAFKAVGDSKIYSLPSSTMRVTVNAVKPAATTLTKVTGDKGSFTATWDPQENVDGYAVQYATNSSFTSCRTSMVYGASATSATVNSLNAGTYYVRVRTFRIVGSSKIYSLASNSLTVRVASTRPAATMLTKVVGGEGSFTATWNAQKDVDGYAVQYATNSSFTSCMTLMVDDASTASATVSGLPAGTFYVRVRTFTTAGSSKTYSLASNALTVTVRVAKPTATVLTKVTGGDGSFTAAWNAKQNVDGYAVQYATNSSFTSCKTVMVYGASATSKAVKDLPSGTYYVRVRTFKTVDGAKNYSLASAYLTVTVK